MKRTFFIALMSFVLCFTCNCKGGDGARGGEQLNQLVGTWNAASTIVDRAENFITATSGAISIKQLAPDTIGFELSIVAGVGQFGIPNNKACKVSLKHAPSSGKYLLNVATDSPPTLENFPLTYSQSDGYAGQSTVTVHGQPRVVTASIKASGSGYVWSVSADESGPALKYEFEMKEKATKTN